MSLFIDGSICLSKTLTVQRYNAVKPYSEVIVAALVEFLNGRPPHRVVPFFVGASSHNSNTAWNHINLSLIAN
jgi:hypothetical protein